MVDEFKGGMIGNGDPGAGTPGIAVAETTTKQEINMSFKGKLITGAQLKDVEMGAACQRLVPKDERPKDGHTPCKIPQFFILEKTEDGPKGTLYVHYINATKIDGEYKRAATHVPLDMPFKILEGKVGTERVINYEKHRTANLDQYLSHLAMSIGTDPEMFVVDGKNNIIPAFSFLTGQKDKDVVKTIAGAKVFNDGFQAEWETISGGCLAYLCDSTQLGMAKLFAEARKKDKTAKFTPCNVFAFSKSYLQSLPEEQVELGCAPSLNIYGLQGKIGGDPRDICHRAAGGHMHFGCGQLKPEALIEVVKSLDAIVGVAAVSLFAEYDNPVRRQYYGLPGEYRLPKHGIEYRTLSNAWLIHPTLMHICFDLARKACSFGFNGLRKYYKGTEEEIIDTIVNCDVKKARELMEANKPLFLGLLKAAYKNGTHETAYDVFYKGVNEVVANPYDFEKNWCLTGGWSSHSAAPGKCWLTAAAIISKGGKL